MNMLLHGIGDIDAEPSIEPTDALIAPPKQTTDYVLTRLSEKKAPSPKQMAKARRNRKISHTAARISG